jgi:hypothetical protein
MHPAEPDTGAAPSPAASRRVRVIAGAILLAAAVAFSWYNIREHAAGAQDPAGYGTAAAAGGDEPPPEPPADGTPPAAVTAAPRHAFGSSAAEAARCLAAHQGRIASAAAAQRADTAARRPGSGRDPVEAERYGWYPPMPDFLDGSILPCARIVAYYGHPNSTRMGVLGEYPKEEMLRRLRDQVAEWERADPATPVVPALHMVAVVAQGSPGPAGLWRAITADRRVLDVYDWAREIDGVFFIDIQVGLDDIRNLLPRFDWILKNPDVHLGIDPEFMMKDGTPPGRRIGTMDAADINFAIDHLAALVREHGLPPKVLVIHRFTQRMVTNYRNVRLRPEVQVVLHMDGHGRLHGPLLKYDTYRHFIVREPIQFAGWKNFYHHDNERGVMPTAADLMRLHPLPLYVQYQ